MDAKVTLAFDEDVIAQAKQFADARNISLSRLTELIYRKMTSGNYESLEDLPIADWVNMVSEGAVEYRRKPRSRQDLKQAYHERR
ncbi:MAG: DUF6364 family protein [Chitinophagaceae bacterium]